MSRLFFRISMPVPFSLLPTRPEFECFATAERQVLRGSLELDSLTVKAEAPSLPEGLEQ